MNVAVLSAILGPLVGAFALLVLGAETDPDTGRASAVTRAIAGIALADSAVGVIAILVRTLRHGSTSVHGFTVDPWRALLALGALVIVATLIASSGAVDGNTLILALAGFGTLIISVFAEDTVVFGGALIVTTIATCAVLVLSGHADARAVVWRLALSDAVILGGLVLVAVDGVRTPPVARGAGACAMLTGIALRVGSVPGARRFEEIASDQRCGALVSGAVRVQAVVVAAWVARSGSEAATVMAIGAALLAAWCARRAARDSDEQAGLSAHVLLATAGIAVHTTASISGSVLLLAGSFLAVVLARMGRGATASATLGAAPLGATLPGAALIAQATFARIGADRPSLAAAIPAAACFLWLAHAGAAGVRACSPRSRAAWSIVPVLAVAAFVSFPATILVHGAAHAATALGALPTLRPLAPAISNDLGIAFAGAAIVAVLLAAPSSASHREHLVPAAISTSEPRVPWPTIVLEVVALGWWGALLGIAIHRGFL